MSDNLPLSEQFRLVAKRWVDAGRKWWDFVSYSPKLPLFVKRVERDEQCIKDIAAAVAQFNDELALLVAWLRSYGTKVAA